MAHRPTQLTFPFVVYVLAMCLISFSARATEWSATPSVRLEEVYSDNILLTTTPEPGVTGTITTPRLDLTAQQENWSLASAAQWTNSRYSGQKGLDANGQYLFLTSNYDTQRSIWQLGGSYANESVLTSTQTVADIGLVHHQAQRITRSITPTWTWNMSEASQLQLAYVRNDVTYGNNQGVALYNYTQDSTSLTLTDKLSARTQLFGVASYADYHVPELQLPGTGLMSKTSSVQIGFSRKISETLTGSLSAGAQRTHTYGKQCVIGAFVLFGQLIEVCAPTPTSTTDSGSVYNATLQKQYETGSANLLLSKSIAPSGAGTQIQTETYSLNANRQLTERLTGAISVNYYRLRAVSSNVVGVDRNFLSAGPNLQWRWTEHLTASAMYQYLWQKGTDVSGPSAASNSVFLTLSYAWPGFNLSR